MLTPGAPCVFTLDDDDCELTVDATVVLLILPARWVGDVDLAEGPCTIGARPDEPLALTVGVVEADPLAPATEEDDVADEDEVDEEEFDDADEDDDDTAKLAKAFVNKLAPTVEDEEDEVGDGCMSKFCA